ncbi:MAG: hypothetical protein K2X93_19235 [Candidatus Obscuribacterales bacterium]|nr:hypothetical protein [Candidatus Obscuribacterales bacterium]
MLYNTAKLPRRKLIPNLYNEIIFLLKPDQPKPALRSFIADSANHRLPTDAELWALLQRLISFEEPDARFGDTKKALKKLLPKSAAVETLSLEEHGYSFSHFFGLTSTDVQTEQLSRANFLVSLILAYEDLRRFNKLAFDAWMKTGWRDENLSEARIPKLRLSASEQCWLASAALAVPDWTRLSGSGPWSDDPRADFVATFCRHVMFDFDPTLWEDVDKLFDKGFALWIEHLQSVRASIPGTFLPQIIVLAEGPTEALLLPAFANALGLNLNSMATHVEACGGAQQVVKQYLNWKEVTVLPIVCLLDNDVSEAREIINDSLRAQDRVVTVSAGEIEDSFSAPVFSRLLNLYLERVGCLEPIKLDELTNSRLSRIDTLNRLFKQRGLGSFDKIGFAEVVVENLERQDVPEDGKRIIGVLTEIQDAGVKLRSP